MNIERILIATDYSECSRHAMKFASSLARDLGAHMLIVHVSNREPSPVGELFDEGPQVDPAELHDLRAIVPTFPEVSYEHHLLQGTPGSVDAVKPADEIVRFAEQQGVDAIVIGTHGRSGLQHLLMGSVGESVVRAASCPVITVK